MGAGRRRRRARSCTSSLDRTFVADGVRWIVDFKTGTPRGRRRRARSSTREAERYRAQLERYARIVARARPAADPPRALLPAASRLARWAFATDGVPRRRARSRGTARRKSAKIQGFADMLRGRHGCARRTPRADLSRPARVGRRPGRADDRQFRRRPSRPPGDARAARSRPRTTCALPPAVLTFDPHPREFFAPRRGAAAAVVAARQARAASPRSASRDVYVARFDARARRARRREAFIDDVLVRRLGARWVLVGEDFRFGKGRAGDLATLRARARDVQRRGDAHGRRSTASAHRRRRCATALADGDLARAAALLGRPYAIVGRVAHGDKLGRSLGFPTANLALRAAPPLTGIFAVRVHGLGAAPRAGVASLGVRPTVTRGRRSRCSRCSCSISTRRSTAGASRVEFLHKLRDEERYPRPRRARRARSAPTSRRRATISPPRAAALTRDRQRTRMTGPACPTHRRPTTRPR